MARDFAKGKQERKTPARRKPTPRRQANGKKAGGSWRSGLRFYGAGVVTGFFLSFLVYLGTLPSTGNTGQGQHAAEQAEEEAPKPSFDFYTLLPQQTIDIDVEPASVSKPLSTSQATEVFLLQAGSFRQRDDADRRRAELLLLGLDPKVEETTGDNGRWYRVYLGPFASKSKMASARSLTANQNIDTLLLKRSKP